MATFAPAISGGPFDLIGELLTTYCSGKGTDAVSGARLAIQIGMYCETERQAEDPAFDWLSA